VPLYCNSVMYCDEITSEKVCPGKELMVCTLFTKENKMSQIFALFKKGKEKYPGDVINRADTILKWFKEFTGLET